MVYDLDRYSKEFEDNKLKLTKLNDNITELNMNNTTYDVSILQGRDKLNKLNTDINNINNKILEYTKELEQTDADIRLLRERKKYIKSDDNLDKINNIK